MKDLKLAGIAGLVLSAIGALVNYLYYQANGRLLLKHSGFGGEITIETGYGGLQAFHVYGMMEGDVTTHTLRFNPLLFFVSFALTALVIFIILQIIRRVR